MDKSDFSNAVFKNCCFVGTNFNKAKKEPTSLEGIEFMATAPSQNSISEKLVQVIESLRSNDIIRRSNTLHCKKGKVNTITVYILEKTYTEEQLIELLPKITELLTTQFYTISYLKQLLKKAENIATIK